MADAPSFREEYVSQIPAVRLLKALGYTYLMPAEALALRGDRPGEVILDGILAPWLAEHNAITARGCTIPSSRPTSAARSTSSATRAARSMA